MSKWDGKFNGTYSTSKYAEQSLEDDLLDAMSGTYTYGGHDDGLCRDMPHHLDNWFPGDGKGNYPHFYYNGPKDYGPAPDGRHDSPKD